MYNLTEFENSANIMGQFVAINANANYIPAHMILLGVFIISFIMIVWHDAKAAFLASSAFTALLSIGLFFIKAINQITLISCLVIFFISIITYFAMKE